jgi:phosphoglycerol transferase MdoB-like AlkP superfamily enzyme
MKKILAKLKNIILFISLCFFFFSYWLNYNFGRITIDQLNSVLSLEFSDVSSDTKFGFIKWVIILPVIIFSMLHAGHYFKKKWTYSDLLSSSLLFALLIVFSLKVNTDFFLMRSTTIAEQKNNFFADYKNPLIPEQKINTKSKNIIWIFVESLEKDYQDEAILNHLQKSTAFMSDLDVSPLINKFTIGGVLSAKCGAPLFLKSFFHQNSMSKSAFSNATCFDDVLRLKGYDSYFLVGHEAEFSGLEDYYLRHANVHVLDKKYFVKANIKKNSTFDTYPDEVLFMKALQILKSQELKKPYVFNLLTLDNHAPNGYPSDYCKKNYGEYIADIIKCNSDLLARFVDDLKTNGVLDDTVLVIMGDHPFMGDFPELPDDRKIFAKIYSPITSKKIVNSHPSPFDFFPAVLSAAGIETNSDQYGFGYSFYDVKKYPKPEWKVMLNLLAYQRPTNDYFKLHYK